MYSGAKCIHLAILEDFNLKSNSFKTLAFQRVWLVIENRIYLHSHISFKITESHIKISLTKISKCQLVFLTITAQNFTARFWFCKISHRVNKKIKSRKIQSNWWEIHFLLGFRQKKAAQRSLKISESKIKLNQVKYVSNYMITWEPKSYVFNMALPVVEFSRQGYKIGKVFA